MKKYKLYVMPGSESSQEAERLLEKSGLAYEKIVVDNVELMNAVVYEFGIKKAPALYANGEWYEGLENIRKFIQGDNKTKRGSC